ncbi:2-hydroxymuconate tautomerase [Fodinicola feengrottensis]|uniref:2-hydroxymuconate tautomerase n=1 Tax=Fodinicola feengrottensis TaxID=435914 RepID=UPI0031CDDE69
MAYRPRRDAGDPGHLTNPQECHAHSKNLVVATRSTPTSKDRVETMPIINVQMFPGRTAEQKAAMAQKVTDAFLETCGRPGQSPASVTVIITEVAHEHWAVGGKLDS